MGCTCILGGQRVDHGRQNNCTQRSSGSDTHNLLLSYLTWQNDFAEVVKLRTSKGDYPGYFGGAGCPKILTLGPYRGKRAAGELEMEM